MKLLDAKEAAKFLGISTSTLAIWRQHKKGPKFVKVGKSVKYKLEDLEKFIKENTQETTSRF